VIAQQSLVRRRKIGVRHPYGALDSEQNSDNVQKYKNGTENQYARGVQERRRVAAVQSQAGAPDREN